MLHRWTTEPTAVLTLQLAADEGFSLLADVAARARLGGPLAGRRAPDPHSLRTPSRGRLDVRQDPHRQRAARFGELGSPLIVEDEPGVLGERRDEGARRQVLAEVRAQQVRRNLRVGTASIQPRTN